MIGVFERGCGARYPVSSDSLLASLLPAEGKKNDDDATGFFPLRRFVTGSSSTGLKIFKNVWLQKVAASTRNVSTLVERFGERCGEIERLYN